MSEFRIIKCKSCTASLVELEGQKIKKCVQCGYDFAGKINKKAKLESVVDQAFENQSGNYNQKDQSSQSKNQVTKQTKSQASSQKASQTKKVSHKPKKPTSVIATIIKWYIILAIISGILKGFF